MFGSRKPICFGRGDVVHPQEMAENDCYCCPHVDECKRLVQERMARESEEANHARLLDELLPSPSEVKRTSEEERVLLERECIRRVSEIRRAAEQECKPFFDILADIASRRMMSGPLCEPYNGYLVGVDPGRPGSDRTVKVRLESEDVE